MARSSQEIPVDPPYDKVLDGVLSFKTFEDAERTLLRLEELRQNYIAQGDDKGCECCRRVALAGRRRAEGISRDPRVKDSKRRQKKEISFWFQVWLETPAVFFDWLAIRKRTSSFLRLSAPESLAGAGQEDLQNGKKR